jgi:hypothetical protein
VINPKVERLIKIGYLKWKTPTDISRGIRILLEVEIRPLDIHNYIQGKHQEWGNARVYCKKCNIDIKHHPRCIFCTKLVHLPERCCGVDHF